MILKNIVLLIIATAIIIVGLLFILDLSGINAQEKVSESISDLLSGIFGRNDVKLITSNFKSSRIAELITDCWNIVREKETDYVCYVLKGTFNAKEDEIRNELRADISSHLKIETDFSEDKVVTKYYKAENQIILQ